MTIGKRIRARRKELHLTIKAVNENIGIPVATMSDMENDKYPPSAEVLIKLSSYFNCTTDWILLGINNSGTPNTAEVLDDESKELLGDWSKLSREGKRVTHGLIIQRLEAEQKESRKTAPSLSSTQKVI